MADIAELIKAKSREVAGLIEDIPPREQLIILGNSITHVLVHLPHRERAFHIYTMLYGLIGTLIALDNAGVEQFEPDSNARPH